MMHFGTDVSTWDVVNEAIDPSQPDGYRRSPWFNIIGPEFIDVAFQTARQAVPSAKLYYNDFSTTDTTKLAFIAALVSGMKSRGVPIDGVGHQMHNNVDFPSGAAVTNAIDTIAALGVDNSVTELDVSVYSGSFPGPVIDYTNIPADRFVLQGYRYRTFFEVFKTAALAGKLKSVTFWGKSDAGLADHLRPRQRWRLGSRSGDRTGRSSTRCGFPGADLSTTSPPPHRGAAMDGDCCAANAAITTPTPTRRRPTTICRPPTGWRRSSGPVPAGPPRC
jgi:GH35 family endo-1,4-beta-xylanase